MQSRQAVDIHIITMYRLDHRRRRMKHIITNDVMLTYTIERLLTNIKQAHTSVSDCIYVLYVYRTTVCI